jgi:hypothetical protein
MANNGGGIVQPEEDEFEDIEDDSAFFCFFRPCAPFFFSTSLPPLALPSTSLTPLRPLAPPSTTDWDGGAVDPAADIAGGAALWETGWDDDALDDEFSRALKAVLDQAGGGGGGGGGGAPQPPPQQQQGAPAPPPAQQQQQQ